MDRRFAVVIGINNYTKDPLSYCVQDANEIADVLEKRCRFQKADIFKITSEDLSAVSDVSGHFDQAITAIAAELKPNEDSVFFYFAGHGEYHFSKSGLWFHDTLVEIGLVFDKFNALQPKYQCYVIDACESGGKLLTRSKKQEDLIEKYISKSNGILFMYGATENEAAKEFSKFKHGLFTYHFLEAINNDGNYDADGVLTPNRIHDIIAKATSGSSGFTQTPVIENRTIGYYPFAFKTVTSHAVSTTNSTPSTTRKPETISEIEKEYFPFVPEQVRKQLFISLRPEIEDLLSKQMSSTSFTDYEIKTEEGISPFPNYIGTQIDQSLIRESATEKVPLIGGLIASSVIDTTVYDVFPARSILDSFMGRNKPKTETRKWINWNSEDILGYSFFCKSKNITCPNAGITIAIYQSLYGIGFSAISFYLDYNGYGDTELVGPWNAIYAFKVHRDTGKNIMDKLQKAFANFEKDLVKWKNKRQQSIEEFNSKAM